VPANKGKMQQKRKKHQWWFYVCMCSRKMWSDGFFFIVFFNSSFDRQFSAVDRKKTNMMVFKDVCMCKAKTIIDGFFFSFFYAPFPNQNVSNTPSWSWLWKVPSERRSLGRARGSARLRASIHHIYVSTRGIQRPSRARWSKDQINELILLSNLTS